MPGPWDRYASQTTATAVDGPWNKYGPPSSTQAPPERHFWQPTERERTGDPNAPMQPSIEDKWLGTAISNAWDAVKGLPGSLKEAFTAPPTPQESKQYGIGGAFEIPSVGLGPKRVIANPPNLAEQTALGIGRMVGQPIQNATEWYANEYRLKHLPQPAPGDLPTLEKMGTVSAEGFGQAAGNVIAAKALPVLGEQALRATRLGQTYAASTSFGEALRQKAAELTKPPEPVVTPEAQAKYDAAVEKARVKYEQDVAAEQNARQKWVQKTYEAKQSDQAAEAVANRRVALERGQEALSERALENIRNAHETVRNNLNGRWEALRQRMGDAAISVQPILGAIDKSRQMLAGVPEDLKIFNEIVNSIDQAAAESTAASVMGEAPATGSGVPFNNARVQMAALGEKWSSASGNLRRALKNVYDTYGNQLQTAADAAGTGNEYRALRTDWHQYVEDWQGKGPLAKALQAPHPTYLQPMATGKPSVLLTETLGRYRGAGANPDLIAQIRRLSEQAQALPKTARTLKPPPPYEAKTPQLQEVPPPTPETPPPGILRRHVPRVVGKVVGGAVGSAFGHPLIGYSIGGEIGSELINRKLPSIPTTPEGYTRTLLEAKEGRLSPGEADRRISKGGGSTKVKRIQPPPEQEP